MNNGKRQPWYGLDDFGDEVLSAGLNHDDPKPGKNEKSNADQEDALNNPEASIDKDPEQPWVQDNTDHPRDTEIGVNEVHDYENGDPPIDNWAEPGEPPKGIPHAR